MNDTQKALLKHIAAALFGIPTDEALTQEVLAEAQRHAVLTMMPITGTQTYWQMIFNNVSVIAAHQKLHALMTRHGIPYVVLKGFASASYYPVPDRRDMGDVDFIVLEEDFERACKALDAEGYTGKRDMQEHHVCYETDAGRWELHWRAPGFPENHVIEEYTAGLVKEAAEYDGCMCPSPFHHGLILLSHSAAHWIGTGIGLRHLCDWAVFVARYSEDEFLAMFEAPLKRVGLWRYAQLITDVCIRYLGVPEREWVGNNDPELVQSLIEDIMDSGNFGVKDKNRLNQAKFIADESRKSVDDSGLLRQLMRTLVKKARMMWPACDRCKLLIPIAVVVVSVRHLYRVAVGRRPEIDLSATIGDARKRKTLYQRFELFKTE